MDQKVVGLTTVIKIIQKYPRVKSKKVAIFEDRREFSGNTPKILRDQKNGAEIFRLSRATEISHEPSLGAPDVTSED